MSNKRKDLDLYTDMLETLTDYRNALLKHGLYEFSESEYRDLLNEHESLLERLAKRLKLTTIDDISTKSLLETLLERLAKKT